MKPSALVKQFLDRAPNVLPSITAWLWLPGLLGTVYYGARWYDSGDEGLTFPCAAILVFGALFSLSRRCGWRAKEWLSIFAWVSVLSVANLYWFEIEPRTDPLLALLLRDMTEFPGSILECAKEFVLLLISVRWIAIVSAFAFILSLHRGAANSEETVVRHSIGGRWKLVPAVIAGSIVGALVESYPPFALISLNAWDLGFLDWASPATNVLDMVLMLSAGFAFFAWKTGAWLTVDERGVRASLAPWSLGLFSFSWRRVLRARELTLRGRTESVALVLGVLPIFRFQFALHKRRDGGDALDHVLNAARRHGVYIEQTSLRRGSTFAGWALLGAAIVSAWLMLRLQEVAALTLADSTDVVAAFVGSDHFISFGAMTALSALFLGLGLGFLFARTDGAIRAVPMLGVAVAAAMLPDPLIYWLVYIAIYAILLARPCPVEMHPWIPFPDPGVSELGMWLVGAKALFAVGGFVLAHMIAVRPWWRALPSFPYRLPWTKTERAPGVQEPTRLESRAV